MIYVWLTLFIVLVFALWGLNFLGLPGNWLIVLLAITWIWLGPEQYAFSWKVLIPLLLLAIVGEVIEFAASVLGAKKLGGSNRGATLSVIGGMMGAILGAVMGIPIPIPIVGVLLGSVLFAALGAMAGAMIGEHWHGKTIQESAKIGGAAFLGRLLGTVGKLTVGAVMVVITVVGAFLF